MPYLPSHMQSKTTHRHWKRYVSTAPVAVVNGKAPYMSIVHQTLTARQHHLVNDSIHLVEIPSKHGRPVTASCRTVMLKEDPYACYRRRTAEEAPSPLYCEGRHLLQIPARHLATVVKSFVVLLKHQGKQLVLKAYLQRTTDFCDSAISDDF